MDIRSSLSRFLKRSKSSYAKKQADTADRSSAVPVPVPVSATPEPNLLPLVTTAAIDKDKLAETQVEKGENENNNATSQHQAASGVSVHAQQHASNNVAASSGSDRRSSELAHADKRLEHKDEHSIKLDQQPVVLVHPPTLILDDEDTSPSPLVEQVIHIPSIRYEQDNLLRGINTLSNTSLTSQESSCRGPDSTRLNSIDSPPSIPSTNSVPTPENTTPLTEANLHKQDLAIEQTTPAHLLLADETYPPSAVTVIAASPNDVSALVHTKGPRIAAMQPRKIWLKRPNASATRVQIKEDDLVDDVRDMLLKKYANSLGRSFDSPDVLLRIVSRAHGNQSGQERLLGPEEDICRTLDQYYPDGQKVDDALIIDVPPKKTPRPSPRVAQHATFTADSRPEESGSDYFPPMPAALAPAVPHTTLPHDMRTVAHPGVLQLPDHARSLSVLNTGQVPPLPSPGAASRRHRDHRPKYGRQHTSSPTIVNHNSTVNPAAANPVGLGTSQHLPHRPSNRPRHDSNASERPNGIPAPPPLPTPPAPEAAPTANKTGTTPPTPLAREHSKRPKRSRKATPINGSTTGKGPSNSSLTSSLLDGSVPPINVLIVEDNIINLKLLEAFMKRLKVRWSTAMNGQIAVNKWRTGGFHLVLMDIQLPIMSGLEATKEIRRLERVNGIGVFSSSSPANAAVEGPRPNGVDGVDASNEQSPDKLASEEGLFKSPVIIVALTASSLQSDRHEALAAGCNDFLTKPVNFVWLERKVKEWGCMQALIDFDGWRKWKDFSVTGPGATTAAKKGTSTTGGQGAATSTSSVPAQAVPASATTTTTSLMPAPQTVEDAAVRENNTDSTDNTDSLNDTDHSANGPATSKAVNGSSSADAAPANGEGAGGRGGSGRGSKRSSVDAAGLAATNARWKLGQAADVDGDERVDGA